MQPRQRLVGGDADQHLETLAEQTVREVEEPGQALSGAGLRVGGDELVAVLEHEQPPAWRRVVVVVVTVAEHHAHEVARVRQQLIGIDDVLEVTPAAPGVREPSQRSGLAGPRRAVEQNASRGASAEPLEAPAVAEEVDDLLQLLLRLVETGDVGPGNLHLRPLHDGSRFRPRHEAHRVEEEDDQDPEEDDRQPRDQRVLEVHCQPVSAAASRI